MVPKLIDSPTFRLRRDRTIVKQANAYCWLLAGCQALSGTYQRSDNLGHGLRDTAVPNTAANHSESDHLEKPLMRTRSDPD